jgi:uncharacterized protein YdiU (UPF0061 family)
MPVKSFGWNLENTYKQLPETLYAPINETKISPNQSLVLFNEKLAQTLGLKFNANDVEQWTNWLSGNELLPNSSPIAQAYAGHQFGHFTMLGDGRAMLLGEQRTPSNQLVDIQLKGSGTTPFSRRGDGKATLYSMLREYVISEALFQLGIPTTRSLAIIKTGEKVNRQFAMNGGILTRVAASHIRVGTFEYVSRSQSIDNLKEFTNYVINRHYPTVATSDNPALELLKTVQKEQISLIVHWMRVGFIHGVMNTDNTTISGESIDYGPCAFMHQYNPQQVYSSIDQHGRYAFENQPAILQWNLSKLAQALLPLIHENETTAVRLATNVLESFPEQYRNAYLTMMRQKLGLNKSIPEDISLIEDLLLWMEENKADYTNTFNYLREIEVPNQELYYDIQFQQWLERWNERLSMEHSDKKEAFNLMQTVNPVFIPRNHLVEEAIFNLAERYDSDAISELLSILEKPYEYQVNKEKFMQLASDDFENRYQTFCGT